MIPAGDLIARFQAMLTGKWGYIPGTAGGVWTQQNQDTSTDSLVKQYGQQWVGHHVADCSGAFVYAYRQFGQSIYHGSNRIAREYVVELLPPSMAKPGMAAFKARKPGQQYYDLPAEYRQGGKRYNGDLNDYYHIGLVDSDPDYVINAASTQLGVIRSKLSNGWGAVGYLKSVDYDNKGDDDPMKTAYVYAENGKTVNIRKGAGVTYAVIAQVPIGSEVTVQGETNTGWSAVKYGEKSGYMMTKFLMDAPGQNDGGASDESSAGWNEARKQAYAYLQSARMEIDAAMALLSDAG